MPGPTMSTFPRRFWQDMTTEEFRALDAARVIALLPVGAIEQHGPHLPVAVDACINAGIVARALELLPAELPVTVLPPLPVGKSNEHQAFPGTLTLSAETLAR
ncbi:MAG TPA: creatininase family protein, partial [Geminicoccaceae bacterium]|nr:creatininase family protein [Geminicoccaceae bacterium]